MQQTELPLLDVDSELWCVSFSPEIQKISRAEWFSTAMHQPKPSNIHQKLKSSRYYTRDNIQPQKHKRSPEPPHHAGASWLAERERSARKFSDSVEVVLGIIKRDYRMGDAVLKSWEVNVDRYLVRRRAQKRSSLHSKASLLAIECVWQSHVEHQGVSATFRP